MNSREIKVFTSEDFSAIIGEAATSRLQVQIKEINIEYTELTPEERDDCIRLAIKILLDPGVDKSGEHRLGKWEKGWTENLDSFKNGDPNTLVPKYFYRDNSLVSLSSCGKLRQRYIRPVAAGLDYKMLAIILEWLFEKYAKDADSIYEFGCGTGHHLLRLREINDKAKLYGLDWAEASQAIIKEMESKGLLKNVYGKKFDFFNPDESFVLDKDSVVYTVGALEQVGDKHEKFIDYLIKNKPKICFHVEPVGEALDETNLLDFLAQEYYKKRNYLSNFIGHLKELEKEGKIVIQKIQRTYLSGSLLAEYVVVVWSPVE